MATHNLLTTVIFCQFLPSISTLQIQATPRDIIHGDTQTLRLKCIPGSDYDTISRVFKLVIWKGLGTRQQNLAEIDTAKSAELLDHKLQPRARVSGSLTDSSTINSFYLTLDLIHGVTCTDAGVFGCSMTGKDNKNINIDRDAEVKVTSTSKPKVLGLKVFPAKPQHSVGSKIVLNCSGNIGIPRQPWRWEWRDKDGTLWLPYPYSYHVDNGKMSSSDRNCQTTGWSTLTYTTKSCDDALQFRCLLGNSDQYGANSTLRLNEKSSRRCCAGDATSKSRQQGFIKKESEESSIRLRPMPLPRPYPNRCNLAGYRFTSEAEQTESHEYETIIDSEDGYEKPYRYEEPLNTQGLEGGSRR